MWSSGAWSVDFLLFLQKFLFFSFESVRIFCPTFYNLRWCVLNTFALHKSKHRFCPLLINECKKKSFCQKQKADVRTVIVVAKMMSHRSASAQWPKNRNVSQTWLKNFSLKAANNSWRIFFEMRVHYNNSNREAQFVAKWAFWNLGRLNCALCGFI